MKRIIEGLGVDYVQWRALVRAYTWMDWAAISGAYGPAQARNALISLVATWGMLSTLGLIAAFLVWSARDPFFASNAVVAMAMLWAVLLVTSQPASIASPDDLAIVGFRPVTSRTYFAVRLTSLLVSVLETTAIFAILPIVAFVTRRDGTILLGIAATVGIFAATVAIAMGVIAAYGWLIRIVSPKRLARILSYAGGALSLGLSAGIVLAIQGFTHSEEPLAFMDVMLPRDVRTMWFPGAWFASYVPIAAGQAGRPEWFGAAGSVLLILAFAWVLRGRMSMDYARRLADVGTLTDARRPSRSRGWGLLRNETRAIALILAAHLRGDMRFQLAIASNVVMAILITAGSTGFEMPRDPFLVQRANSGAFVMPLFALTMIPLQTYQTVAMAQIEGAWWPYFSTPADRARLVGATRDVIAVLLLLPVLVLMAGFFTYAFGNVWHAALHTTFLALLTYLALQVNVIVKPHLPFSVVLTGKQGNPFSLGAMFLVMLVCMPLALVINIFAYPTLIGRVVALAALLALVVTLNIVGRRRLVQVPFSY